jgi:hypothetical protein
VKAAFLLSTLLASLPLLSHAQDCLQWIKRTDVGSYGQRWQHAMAYDSHRGVTVFFGGEIGKDREETYFNDTQEYDGRQWRQISTAVKPETRRGHAMAYDPVRRQIVMFGGGIVIRTSSGFDTLVIFKDTWVYSGDGTSGFWQFQTQATNLPPSYGHEMVWDALNQMVLLHIGPDSWSWNGTNWLKVATSGPLASSFGMAFDSERSTAMIVGGFVQGVATEAVWEKPPVGGWEYRGPGPSSRAQLAMAYDERRKRAVMVGGVGASIETGETAYEYIPGTGWLIIPSLPSGQGRAGAKMVYDSRRGVMVLTGGAGGGAPNAGTGGRYSDTWELWPSLFISGQPSDATNLVCSTTTFSVLAMGASPFQYQWRLDGAPLSDDAHVFGSRTADLRIDRLRQTHAGKYDVVVRDSCSPQNVVTSKVARLTIQPGSEWVLRVTNGPVSRFGHTMVYDSTRRVTVMFGGRTNWNVAYCLNDLWEWNGARWTQRMPNTVTNGWTNTISQGWKVSHSDVPVQRYHHAMAYDSRRARVVMFGGQAVGPNVTTANLRDLWEWDGTQWHFRATNGPIPRIYGSMAFDERRGRTVLFGGQPLPGLGETAETELVWEWDGERWHTNLPPANPSSANYRAQSRMTYDSFRGVAVFGPTTENWSHWSFWDWDGVKWTNFPVVHFTDPIVTAFHGTSWGGFDFDKSRRRSTWFGGFQSTTHNKTGFFDGKEWTLLTNSTPPPPPRVLPAMAYDSDRRAHVMFGGSLTYGGSNATNDTWELIAVDVPLINEQPASQYRVAGDSATFGVSAVAPTFLAYQWHHNGAPIPGATASTFTIPNVRPADAGEYSVLVSSACGATRSHPALLTLNPSLQIFNSANATLLIWRPDPAVVLESAESVSGPWMTVPNAASPFAISAVGPAKFFRLRANE